MMRLYAIGDSPRLDDAVQFLLRMIGNSHPCGKDYGELCGTLAIAIAKYGPEARATFLERAPASLKADVNDRIRECAKLSSV